MTHRYRIKKYEDGFEPQMLHSCGAIDVKRWFPLAATGYWAEPDAFSYGLITKRSVMPTREDAERAVQRAKLINSDMPIVSEAVT